jgi:hypothetical protein
MGCAGAVDAAKSQERSCRRAASGAKRRENNQAIGISGGRSTKIHGIVDSKDRSLSFLMTGGQAKRSLRAIRDTAMAAG